MSTLLEYAITSIVIHILTFIQANYNRLLDVARETYKENVGDIYNLSIALSEQHGLPFGLVYHDTGFVFTLKKLDLEGELPRGFINPSLKKGRWQFSSMELVCPLACPSRRVFISWLQKKMNARMKDALDETLILSDKWGIDGYLLRTLLNLFQDYPRSRR